MKPLFLPEKKITLVIFLFLLICCNLPVHAQQLPQFSQNMYNQIIFNPGYAGVSGQINVVALDRHQWVGLDGAPRTTVIGVDKEMKNILGNPGGVGFVIMNDEIGFFRNITIRASLAQQYFLGEGIISIGISAAILNQVFDGTKAITDPGGGGTFHGGTDHLVPGAEESGSAFDTNVGAWYKGNDFSAGFSILHLFEPKPNFNSQLNVYTPRSFLLTAGYTINPDEARVEITPSLLFKYSAGSWQLDLNGLIRFNERYWGGISYRVQDAVVIMAGIELNNGVRFGYSYDITTSSLSNVAGGSHELMVGYTFDLEFERRVNRYRSVRFL